MLQLFVPASKVQKDRQIMRDTDSRVAKYSRRGLILNFIVFVLCLSYGEFFLRETTLAIVLLTGLLLVTLLRGYYLFRFDTLYARAPTRWRNQYFLASFLGAAWWSIILVSLTWSQGMRGETLLMWLYSVVFYSTITSVFAPYRKFLTIYLFIGQVPAALTAILLGATEGYLYGIIMLMFFLMISYQAKNLSIAYWERLESNYALRERAKGLEHEQRSSKAAIALKNEFLINLGHEFRSSLSDILSTLDQADESKLAERERELLLLARKAAERQLNLVNNVVDFSRITTRSLELEVSEFDLRRLLEKQIRDFALQAHQQGVELNFLFDDSMPDRVRGDATRLEQVLATLLSHALKLFDTGHVFIEAEFAFDASNDGELQLIISDTLGGGEGIVGGDEQSFGDNQPVGIALSISKGLAECMGGSVNILKTNRGGHRIALAVKLEVVAGDMVPAVSDQKLAGRRVLLVDFPEVVAHDMGNDMEQWGAAVQIVYGYEQAVVKLEEAAANGKPFDLAVIHNPLQSLNALVLSREIASSKKFPQPQQLIALSLLQKDTKEVKSHLRALSQVRCIEKPILRKRLYDVAGKALKASSESAGASDSGESKNEDSAQQSIKEQGVGTAEGNGVAPLRVLVVEDQRVNQMVISAMLKKLGCNVQVVNSGSDAVSAIDRERYDMLLIDCDITAEENLAAVAEIRAAESASASKRLPILAMVAGDDEKLQSRCQSAGTDDQLVKPLRYQDLQQRLARWLDTAA